MNVPDFIKDCYSGQESFRLYFAGGTNKKLNDWFNKSNALKLFTQVTDRKSIQDYISVRKHPNIFLDSGAWAAHSRGVILDMDEYIDYANSISGRCDAIAQVDKIPGVYKQPKTRMQIMEAPEISWHNYLYMRDKIVEPKKLLPIFHQGEDFKWLKNMLEYKDDDHSFTPYIGISPANDSHVNDKIVFMDKVFDVISKSSNPNVKTHAFGMTSLYLLERYPFWSADSAGWVKKAAYGFVYIPRPNYKLGEMSYQLISFGERKKDPMHFINLDKLTQEYIKQYLESIQIDVGKLFEDNSTRCLANCIYLKNWADNYRFIGQCCTAKKKLF